MQTITLAGGCFWCIEGLYKQTPGVIDAVSGFAGGTSKNPTYDEVASGLTDYREAVQVTYDPKILSTEQLLLLFWRNIDPVDQHGQFADRGYQYTTAIYYHDAQQKEAAFKTRDQVQGRFDSPIATEILAYSSFHSAGDQHQDFFEKNRKHYLRYRQASGRDEYKKQVWD